MLKLGQCSLFRKTSWKHQWKSIQFNYRLLLGPERPLSVCHLFEGNISKSSCKQTPEPLKLLCDNIAFLGTKTFTKAFTISLSNLVEFPLRGRLLSGHANSDTGRSQSYMRRAQKITRKFNSKINVLVVVNRSFLHTVFLIENVTFLFDSSIAWSWLKTCSWTPPGCI